MYQQNNVIFIALINSISHFKKKTFNYIFKTKPTNEVVECEQVMWIINHINGTDSRKKERKKWEMKTKKKLYKVYVTNYILVKNHEVIVRN